MTLNKKELQAKKRELKRIGKELKQEFFGIDYCIDAIMASIKTWYLMPQILARPVIVNLWGLTGVGKTALVRSLVSKLGFENHFIEIQMDGFSNSRSYTQGNTICGILEVSSIEEGRPGIVLLDEFQRFRTVNKGDDVKLERFQDVWMLLSDGRFSSDYSMLSQIEDQIAYMAYEKDRDEYYKAKKALEPDDDEDDDEDTPKSIKPKVAQQGPVVEPRRKFNLSPYEARHMRKLLKCTESLTEVMQWDSNTVLTRIEAYREANRNATIDYSKCLIFVVGNLDEAFNVSGDVDDCDTSADVFYEFTKKIGSVEVKRSLMNRFRPEQIARLGNNHIVYPSLNSDAYRKIIRRECQWYTEAASEGCDITFEIDAQVYDEIYENAVYPAQGTRPVFSSVHMIFGSPLSNAVLWGLEQDVKTIRISLDGKRSELVFNSGTGKTMRVPVSLELRDRKARRSPDFNALVATHESGHALLWAILFKTAPNEIVASLASFEGGYILSGVNQSPVFSKQDTLDRIAMLYGGTVAEEIVFGGDARTTGCGSDIANATSMAAQYVRQYGMGEFSARIESSNNMCSQMFDETDVAIESLLTKQRQRAFDLLMDKKSVLLALAKELIVIKRMDRTTAYRFLKAYIPLHEATEGSTTTPYAELLAEAGA